SSFSATEPGRHRVEKASLCGLLGSVAMSLTNPFLLLVLHTQQIARSVCACRAADEQGICKHNASISKRYCQSALEIEALSSSVFVRAEPEDHQEAWITLSIPRFVRIGEPLPLLLVTLTPKEEKLFPSWAIVGTGGVAWR